MHTFTNLQPSVRILVRQGGREGGQKGGESGTSGAPHWPEFLSTGHHPIRHPDQMATSKLRLVIRNRSRYKIFNRHASARLSSAMDRIQSHRISQRPLQASRDFSSTVHGCLHIMSCPLRLAPVEPINSHPYHCDRKAVESRNFILSIRETGSWQKPRGHKRWTQTNF